MVHKKNFLVIGLTGSIGVGKSTVAKQLSRLGWPVHSSDEAVHRLLGKNGKAVKKVAKLFPEALKRNAIDRQIVGQSVFTSPEKLKQLEAVLHPLVEKEEEKLIAKAKKQKIKVVVLEIPLLFETGAEKRCDFVICVTCSKQKQHERVMQRDDMTEEKFRRILKRQMSDAEKRKRADFIIKTDKDLADTYKQIRLLWPQITKRH